MPQVYPLHSVLEAVAAALVVGASLGSAVVLAFSRRHRGDRSAAYPPAVAITAVPRLMRVDELDLPVRPSATLAPARLYDLVSREWITTTTPMPAIRGRSAVRPDWWTPEGRPPGWSDGPARTTGRTDGLNGRAVRG